MEKNQKDLDPNEIGIENGNTEPQNEERDTEDVVSESDSNKYFHSSVQPYQRSSRKIPFLLGIAAILLILGGAFYFLKVRPGTQEPSPSPKSISPSLEESPSPSPQPSFDRSKYTLRILNGTATQGLAASTSAKLKDLGYRIERTANASNSAFLKTVVRVKPRSVDMNVVKPGLEELLEKMLADLSSIDFKGEEGPQLKDSDTADGEVIIGSE